MNFMNLMNTIVVAGASLALTIMPAFAAKPRAAAKPVKVNEGVALYNQGKYREALPFLLKTIKAEPGNALYHYYLGCCYDRMHSEGSAMGQFLWVSKHSKDQRLRSYAETALHGQGSVTATSTADSSTSDSQSSGASDSTTAGATTSASAGDNNDAVTSSRLPYGRAKIYFFSSANRESQQFAPIFANAARAYRGSLNLVTLDVSAPATRSVMAKYKVSAAPHLIYLDGKGTEIYNEGPKTFNLRLGELLGK